MKRHQLMTGACLFLISMTIVAGCARKTIKPVPFLQSIKFDGQDAVTLLNLHAAKFQLLAPEGSKGITCWLEEWRDGPTKRPYIYGLGATKLAPRKVGALDTLLIKFPDRENKSDRKIILALNGHIRVKQLQSQLEYFSGSADNSNVSHWIPTKILIAMNKDVPLYACFASKKSKDMSSEGEFSVYVKMRFVKD